MKTRTDFVTNSSSSSFIISKIHLTPIQQYLIKNYADAAEFLGCAEYVEWGWTVEDLGNSILFETSMDNFDMVEFLKEIGVNAERIRYTR